MKQGVDLTGFSLQRLFVKLSILCVNGELHKAPLAVQMRTELDVLFLFFFPYFIVNRYGVQGVWSEAGFPGSVCVPRRVNTVSGCE